MKQTPCCAGSWASDLKPRRSVKLSWAQLTQPIHRLCLQRDATPLHFPVLPIHPHPPSPVFFLTSFSTLCLSGAPICLNQSTQRIPISCHMHFSDINGNGVSACLILKSASACQESCDGPRCPQNCAHTHLRNSTAINKDVTCNENCPWVFNVGMIHSSSALLKVRVWMC